MPPLDSTVMFDPKLFQGKHVLITGGARGIGRALSQQFAIHGATVTSIYNQSEALAQSLTQQAVKNNWNLTPVRCDIRKREQCLEVVETAVQRADGIDVLINNSGIMYYDLLLTAQPSHLDEMYNTNVKGTLTMCQAVMPYMMQQRRGNIINISSICDNKGSQGQVQYSASKGAISAITKSLAVELAAKNIRVNAIAPGVIETDMTKAIRDLAPEEVMKRLLCKRFGKTEDIAYAALFLASPYADYITGQVLQVDGGFKMP